MAYAIVLLPLIAYIILYSYEVGVSFWRIGKPVGRGSNYLSATWEITHTLLIMTVTYFVWLFSDINFILTRQVYSLVFAVGVLFIIRAILYLYMFYITNSKYKYRYILDIGFAITQYLILFLLIMIVSKVLVIVKNSYYTVNEQFIIWMVPGMAIILVTCLIPVIYLFRTKK